MPGQAAHSQCRRRSLDTAEAGERVGDPVRKRVERNDGDDENDVHGRFSSLKAARYCGDSERGVKKRTGARRRGCTGRVGKPKCVQHGVRAWPRRADRVGKPRCVQHCAWPGRGLDRKAGCDECLKFEQKRHRRDPTTPPNASPAVMFHDRSHEGECRGHDRTSRPHSKGSPDWVNAKRGHTHQTGFCCNGPWFATASIQLAHSRRQQSRADRAARRHGRWLDAHQLARPAAAHEEAEDQPQIAMEPAGSRRPTALDSNQALGRNGLSCLFPEARGAHCGARAGMLIACSRFLTDWNGKVVCGHALSDSLH